MVQIAVAAYSGEPGERERVEARGFVETLAAECPGAVLFLGGYRGLMRVVVEAALDAGLRVVLVIPTIYEGDVFPDGVVVVRTGMGVRERSAILVRSGDVLVSLGGGVGTLTEVLIACSYGIPVLQLSGALPGSLTERLERCLGGELDPRLGCRVSYVPSGDVLAREACRVARHGGPGLR